MTKLYHIPSDDTHATELLAKANDTVRYCEELAQGSVYYTYRQYNDLQARVNTNLHAAMHHRSHQQEY